MVNSTLKSSSRLPTRMRMEVGLDWKQAMKCQMYIIEDQDVLTLIASFNYPYTWILVPTYQISNKVLSRFFSAGGDIIAGLPRLLACLPHPADPGKLLRLGLIESSREALLRVDSLLSL